MLDHFVSLELYDNHDSMFKMASEGNTEGLMSLEESFGKAVFSHQDTGNFTCLHHAALANQTGVVKYLIEKDVDLNAIDKDGNTALHIATKQLHTELIQLLLEYGIDDAKLNSDGWAGLHLAVTSNNVSLLSTYLGHSYINVTVEGYHKRTPLHLIAEYDNLEACTAFHNAVLAQEAFRKKGGFGLSTGDDDNRTSIHLAAHKGSHRVLNFMLTKCRLHGFTPEVLLAQLDNENSSPLHASVTKGDVKTVQVLLTHGANSKLINGSRISPFLLACSQGGLEVVQVILDNSQSNRLIRSRDHNGESCLHHCARSFNSQELISLLLSKGAEINDIDNKRQTPLMIAIMVGNAKIISVLLDNSADVSLRDLEGDNMLHCAITRKRIDILECLLKLPKAEELVSQENNHGQTPFHRALKLGITSMVELMVSTITHKSTSVQDSSGNNYLHNAAYSGDWKAITSLLEIPDCYLQLNETNKFGETPLHIAASGGHLNCVDTFLSHGAVIHKCHKGMTPLHIACLKGHTEVARALFIAHPVQTEWTNDEGDNVLHMAAKSGSFETITFCLDIGVAIIHNNNFESFFDIIITKKETSCASAVVKHNRYQEALDLVSPIHEPPMISLIAYMPKVAMDVLDLSHKKSNLPTLHLGYWEKFDFKYISLADNNEPSLVKSADQRLKSLESLKKPIDSVALPLRHKSYLSQLAALATMVKFKRALLLTHPVSNAYLRFKWNKYGRWIHIILMLFVFLQMFFLMTFTALVPRPANVVKALTEPNASIICNNGNNISIHCYRFSPASNTFRFLAIALALLNFAVWVVIVVKIRRQAFNIVSNASILIDLLSIIFTIYYLIPTRGLNNAYWQAGAVATFFSWFSLLLRIQLFEVFGLYITMFLAITRRVIQVLLICLLFMISFSVSLYILVGNLEQYSNIGYSFFELFGHFLGELNFLFFIREDLNNGIEFDWLTFIFVIVIAVLLSIVIANMLVGLAVGDIEQIKSDAIVNKKLIEVSFFTLVDSIIPEKLLSRLEVESVTKEPNKKTSLLRRSWRIFWRFFKGERKGPIGRKGNEILRLSENVDRLSIQQEKLIEKLNRMENLQENMLALILDSKTD